MRADRLPLDPSALAFASGLVTALVWTLCTLAFALAPGAAASFSSQLFHLDVTGLVQPITWGGYLMGLICWSLGAGLVVGATGALYNRLLGRRTTVAGQAAA